MSKVTSLYNAIGSVLAPIGHQIYYTMLPSDAVYPHIYVVDVSDRENHHNDVDAGDESIDIYRVQIESRAVDQATVSDTKDEITDLLHRDTDMYARADVATVPVQYDRVDRVYRVGLDYIIHYKQPQGV